MKFITFSTLYPNSAQPRHGLFVEKRVTQFLNENPGYAAEVIAPVPWFPFKGRGFGKYSTFARVREQEKRHGLDVYHPRFLVLPKLGMSIAPVLLALSCYSLVKKRVAGPENVKFIDAHYFYPDGVSATLLGKWLGVPVIVTARGSDVNVIAEYGVPRAQIRRAACRAKHIVAVSDALKQSLSGIGVDSEKISVVRNGVDFGLFQPQDRHVARAAVNLRANSTIVLTVGNLVELKGHELLIRSLALLDGDVELVIIGDGDQEKPLRRLARDMQLTGRVRFCGAVPQSDLPAYYCAADVFALASRSEGLANVWLEALACGTPVVTSLVGGAQEVIRTSVTGRVVSCRSPRAFAEAIRSVLENRGTQTAIRSSIQDFSWNATSAGLQRIFGNVASGAR